MRLICTIFLLLVVASTMWSQQSLYKSDATFPFIVVTSDTVSQAPSFNDQQFYALSSAVIFEVNKTVIPQSDPFMKRYREEVLPYINSRHLQLRKVYIRGAASPEGPYANNRRLGQGRSKALLDELQRDLLHQYVQTETETSCITEDYGYLCLLMKEAGDPDYSLVQQIYDRCGGDEECCKNHLALVQDGKLWKRLFREYFPNLRSARLILWFSEPDEEHAPQLVDQSASLGLPELSLPEPTVIPFVPELHPLDVVASQSPEVRYRRHMLAVRTNLLHDFFYMPEYGFVPNWNVQFEYYPWGGHMTYNLGLTWGTHRKWESQMFFQIRDFQLEARRYFRGGGRFLGLYLGAFGEFNVYGVGLDKKRGWQGEGAGAGLSAGYVMSLLRNKRLRLEFMAAAGYYLTFFDPYVYGNPVTGKENGKYYYNYLGKASAFKKRNHTMSWIGPTNVGIQLTYDILYRKRTKVQQRIDAGKLKPKNCF